MRVFVYECVISGGLGGNPDDSLLTEGLAMARALVEDFSRIPEVEVETSVDKQLVSVGNSLSLLPYVTVCHVDSQADHWSTIERLFRTCDATIIVAPESSGILKKITAAAEHFGVRLLCPSSPAVSLFSDKHQTGIWLCKHRIPVPEGCLLESGRAIPDWVFPAILKPIDGAGSLGVRMVNGLGEIAALDWAGGQVYRLETRCPGQPASVVILCQGSLRRVLAPCRQFFFNGSFDYQGGCVLADGPLHDRAVHLGERVASVLPDDQGYFGVDLILGEKPDGSEDYVIEVNPRITTSYVGLRASTDTNLAQLLLGSWADFDLRFPRRPLEFRSDGTVLRAIGR